MWYYEICYSTTENHSDFEAHLQNHKKEDPTDSKSMDNDISENEYSDFPTTPDDISEEELPSLEEH